ncbi:MAG TPA: hypothetical protein VFL87_07070 [Thermoleophilaceae bacterium]|nr:hypothetical protein [Thermoleophilaceae bacterium]
MRRLFAIAAVALLATWTGVASGSTSLSIASAKHALRSDLARGFGIHRVHASCRHRSRARVSCRWSGRRGRRGYRGSALVERSGRTVTVQLTHVRRA